MRFYADEDMPQDVAPALRRLGQDAVATDELGTKGLSDARQLALATRAQRVLLTCNKKDFLLLHEASVLWSREHGLQATSAHGGILLLPSGNAMGFAEMARVIAAFAAELGDAPIRGRLLKWTPSGWNEVKIE